MFEDLVYLTRLQAREDFVKEASRVASAIRILGTPFRNIKEGVKDYRAISSTIKAEKGALANTLKPSLQHLSDGQIDSAASGLWKKTQQALIEKAPKEMDDVAAHHEALKGLSLVKLREARGRILGGTAQLGVAGLVGKKLLGKGSGASAPPETT